MKLLLLITVSVGVNPEGSEALPFGPKNHSKVGEGTLEGRGTVAVLINDLFLYHDVCLRMIVSLCVCI